MYMLEFKQKFRDCFKRVKYSALGWLYYALSCIPKKRNLWIFGAWNGNMYADNSKYLFEYIIKEHSDIECIWITKKKSVVSEVRAKGYKAYNWKTLKGMWTCMRASTAFITEARSDVAGVLTAGSMIVQLWHGMGIKDVSHNRKSKNDIRMNSKYYDLAHAYRHQFWMVPCEDAIKKYSEAMDVPKEQFFITGQPKDDTFINATSNEWIDKLRNKNGARIVAYLPTHRKFGQKKNNDNKENILSYDNLVWVNEKLKNANIIMIFKPHFHEFKNYEGLNTNFSNIVFATDINIFGDVYKFLPACDAMITDYSGIMLGYLNNCKPQVYFPYDMKSYQEDDFGFCYPYQEVAVGPICYDWEHLISALEEILKEDTYLEKRKELRDRFCYYHDGKNCERVYCKTLELLETKYGGIKK